MVREVEMQTEQNGNSRQIFVDATNIGDVNRKKDFLVACLTPSIDGMVHYSILHLWSRLMSLYKYVINIVVEDTYLDLARNKLVETARKIGIEKLKRIPDYYFFVDQDSVVLPSCFEDLVKHNLDIVSGFYVKKNGLEPVHKMLGEWKKGDIVKANAIGFGGVLIKGKVFEKMSRPWFKLTLTEQHGEFSLFGEDNFFSKKALKYGYSLNVDTNVEIGHHGSTIYPEDYYLRGK